jgi:hypothetical protein
MIDTIVLAIVGVSTVAFFWLLWLIVPLRACGVQRWLASKVLIMIIS